MGPKAIGSVDKHTLEFMKNSRYSPVMLMTMMCGLVPRRVVGYSTGAPEEACEGITPGHGEPARDNSQPEYTIKVRLDFF